MNRAERIEIVGVIFERQLIEVANLPGVGEWWEIRGSWFSDEFQDYINEVIESGPVAEPQNYLDESCLPVQAE